MKKHMDEVIAEHLLENYEKYYRFAYSFVRNEHDALDIVQESSYKAIKKSDHLKSTDSISTWIYQIVRNCALDFIRAGKKMEQITETLKETYTETYDTADIDFDIMDSLNHLDEVERTIIILRYFEDYKLEQIAQLLNENVNTIKSKLYRSLKKLKLSLKEEDVI